MGQNEEVNNNKDEYYTFGDAYSIKDNILMNHFALTDAWRQYRTDMLSGRDNIRKRRQVQELCYKIIMMVFDYKLVNQDKKVMYIFNEVREDAKKFQTMQVDFLEDVVWSINKAITLLGLNKIEFKAKDPTEAMYAVGE